MFNNTLHVYFLFPHEHFETTAFEAFLMFLTLIKYFPSNTIQETSENKVNYVKDFV